MFIYLGNDVVVSEGDIIGIFDIERVTVDRYMKEYLNNAQKSGLIYYVSLEMPKSIVICPDTVYICGVSCDTLRKRVSRSEIVKEALI